MCSSSIPIKGDIVYARPRLIDWRAPDWVTGIEQVYAGQVVWVHMKEHADAITIGVMFEGVPDGVAALGEYYVDELAPAPVRAGQLMCGHDRARITEQEREGECARQ